VSEGPGPWSVRDSRTGSVVAERVVGAHGFWGRFRGLMGRNALPAGEGLYLAESSIHMFFMRFPIDALFVSTPDASGERRVVDVRPGLRPWTGLVMPVKGAGGVVELPAGTLERAGVQAGSAVRFEPVGGSAGPGASPAG
jgi:uncharacterized membrane protein (UPF0127 family)